MNDFFTGVLPWLLWVGRIALSAVAVLLLIRCGRTLLSGGKQESWGFLSLSNGARYPLYHWENMIGRARQADIRINFPSVSRSHAALCRDSEGIWRIYPIRTGGTLLNGTVVERPTALNPGDALSMGGVDIYFFPDQKQARRPVRTAASPGTLWLLTLFQVLMFLPFLPGLTAGASLPVCIGFGGLVLLSWVFCSLRRTGSRGLEVLALLLTTVGFAVTAAYDSQSLYKQLAAVVLGMGLYLLMNRVLQSLPLALKLRWPLVAAASALLAFNVLFGQRIFGAKNWIAIGPITFQPSELVKIVFILAGAATLDRLFAKRNLIFTILFSAYCVGCLALMSDFGTALIFFVAFLCIAFLRTGDLPSIVMITAAAGFAGGIVLRFKPYVLARFAVWRHAWEYAQEEGYQQTRTMSAVASGGLFGAGPEEAWLKYVGAANTDLVFGVVSEEFGLLLALCAAAAVILLGIYALRAAGRSRSSFYAIAACATAAMLVFQTTLNVLGSVDLLPLAGVTFPFVSMGGSSMLSCWGLLEGFSVSGIPTVSGLFTAGSSGDLGWSGVGQYEDMVNPCAMLALMGSIASDDRAATPRLLYRETGVLGLPAAIPAKEKRAAVFTAETRQTLRDMMAHNVQETYGQSRFGDLAVCAKSGTAEVSDGAPHAWFVGFVDDNTLPLAFVVVVEHGGSGSDVAGSVAAQLLEQAQS